MNDQTRYSKEAGRAWSRRDMLKLLGVSAAGLALTACGSGNSGTGGAAPGATSGQGNGQEVDFSARFAKFPVADEPNGDLSKVVWPDFIKEAGPEVQSLYEFQIMNGELMKYIPCFCNCGEEDNHQSNRDCYIEKVNPDGSVAFDTMAPT